MRANSKIAFSSLTEFNTETHRLIDTKCCIGHITENEDQVNDLVRLSI